MARGFESLSPRQKTVLLAAAIKKSFLIFQKKYVIINYKKKKKRYMPMFSKETRKLILENRLARLASNGKENFKVRGKILRELKKLNKN